MTVQSDWWFYTDHANETTVWMEWDCEMHQRKLFLASWHLQNQTFHLLTSFYTKTL